MAANRKLQAILSLSILALSLVASQVQATIVQFQTSKGSFEVNLYDEGTPITVANFLYYVNAGLYADTIVHRQVPSFVVQGGGFTITDIETGITAIETKAAIKNEAVYSNVTGTISMAKSSGNINSATSQWFINLKNNSGSLDGTEGGYTVFGEVIGDGMTVVNAIAAEERFNLGVSPFTEVPLQDFSNADAANDVEITLDNFIYVNAVVVLDATTDTLNDIVPVPNTADNSTDSDSGGSSSGGAFYWLLLLLLPLRLMKRSAR